MEDKKLFELPKLITLEGEEITEDRLLEEVLGKTCVVGTGKTCTGGGKILLEEE